MPNPHPPSPPVKVTGEGSGRWRPDVLEGFQQTTLPPGPSWDGPAEATLVRRRSPEGGGAAVLYIHGFVDYFFQTHLAGFFLRRGLHFYAVDLRRSGRSLRPHQLPNTIRKMEEFLADVAAAVEVMRREEGIERILVNGHSTGGLVAALFAHRGPGRQAVQGLFLNSPFLDMNIPPWQERFLEPGVAALGGLFPNLPLPGPGRLYGESLHADHRGSWRYDTRWKPIGGFPPRAGWFRAIHRAHGEVAGGISIPSPILVLHAGKSLRPRGWTEEIRRSDVILDVEDIRRLSPGLGPQVEARGIPGAIHDVMLSEPSAREEAFRLLGGWMDRVGITG